MFIALAKNSEILEYLSFIFMSCNFVLNLELEWTAGLHP